MIYILIPTTKERRLRLEKCINSIRENVSQFPFVICTYENNNEGYVKALSRMIEEIKGVVFLVSDDMVLEKDCIENLYKRYLEAFPNLDGMAQPYENFGHGQNGDSPMIHSDILRPFLELGYHHYADAEIAIALNKQGKYLVVPEAKLFHEHPNEFPELMDETYRQNHSHAGEDNELLASRIKLYE